MAGAGDEAEFLIIVAAAHTGCKRSRTLQAAGCPGASLTLQKGF
jgi:hypothetical protein